jgi:hypothetical protein
MPTWTMYYGQHVLQSGLQADQVQELSQEWEAAVSEGPSWLFVNGKRVWAHASASVAFVPDVPSGAPGW